jgi:hypothetical protein
MTGRRPSAPGCEQVGWERWCVLSTRVVYAHTAVIDRTFLTWRTLWHWRGLARFLRKHPERLRVL